MDLHKFGEIKRIYKTFIVKDREEHINLITKEHEKSMIDHYYISVKISWKFYLFKD